MATIRDNKWNENYAALKEYISKNHHLPDKKKVENRGLLNWWKYQKKCIKLGRLDDERINMLQEISDMREQKVDFDIIKAKKER